MLKEVKTYYAEELTKEDIDALYNAAVLGNSQIDLRYKNVRITITSDTDYEDLEEIAAIK